MEFPDNPQGFPDTTFRTGAEFPDTLREFPDGEFPDTARGFPDAAAQAAVGGCPCFPWVVPGAGVRMPVASATRGPKEGPPTV
jgi:hypothetical protein